MNYNFEIACLCPTFQAFSRLWLVFSELTFNARELSKSACCNNVESLGSFPLRNLPSVLLFDPVPSSNWEIFITRKHSVLEYELMEKIRRAQI